MRKLKIEMFKNKRGKWHFRVRSANNGRIMCHSEAYSSKASCSTSVDALKKGMNGKVPVEEVEYDS